MRKAGITDYRAFARKSSRTITTKPISFEVFSDDFGEMERQALEIARLGPERLRQDSDYQHARAKALSVWSQRLAMRGVKLNVTALMTLAQVRDVADALSPKTPSYVSVFAGRIADTGRDPMPLMPRRSNC